MLNEWKLIRNRGVLQTGLGNVMRGPRKPGGESVAAIQKATEDAIKQHSRVDA
jgi:hypothetical protein